jgi:hypothetical protein
VANNYKVVFEFFESNGSQFNEVYYRSESSIDAAANIPQLVLVNRLANLNHLNLLRQIRVADLGTARLTAVVPVNKPGTNADAPNGQTGEADGQDPLPVGAAIVCGMSGVNGGSRKLWMRGANIGDYQRNNVTGVDMIHPGFTKAFNNQMKRMADAGFGIRTLGKANPLTNPLRNLLKVEVGPTTGTAILTCDGNVALDLTQRLIITRVDPKILPALNGHFTVISAAAPKYTIAYTMPGGTTSVTNVGYVHAELYNAISVFNPARCLPLYLATRTSKNPYTHSRGARRPQRLRSRV